VRHGDGGEVSTVYNPFTSQLKDNSMFGNLPSF